VDRTPSVWAKWDAARGELLKAAAKTWIPIEDLVAFLNGLPGPPLTQTDVTQRLRAFQEEPYANLYPDERVKDACRARYTAEVEAGTEMPAIVGSLQEFADEEEDRLDREQRERWRAQQEADRLARQAEFRADSSLYDRVQLMDQRDAMLSRANAAMAGQSRAPAIMEQAMQLENRVSTFRTQYQQISENLLKAQNSARMATEQRAERLSLVEPANLPDHPFSPNRMLLIGGAAAAGLGLGLLLALGLELVTKPVRSPKQIERLGLPIIGVVPLIKAKTRTRRFPAFLSREKRLAAQFSRPSSRNRFGTQASKDHTGVSQPQPS